MHVLTWMAVKLNRCWDHGMDKYHIPHEAVGVITYAFPNLSSTWLVTGDPENIAGTRMALYLQESFMIYDAVSELLQ